MPRVPRLEGPQVRTAPLPVPQVSAEAMGAPIARAVGQIGGMIGQIAQEEKRKAVVVQSNEAEVRLRQARDRLLYDNRDGALNRLRTNAKDAPRLFGEGWDKEVSSIASSIGDAEVRSLFLQRAGALRAEADGVVLRHVDDELDRAAEELSKTLVADELAVVARAPENGERVNAGIANAIRMRREYLSSQGVDERVIDREVEAMETNARLAQITGLLSKPNGADAAMAVYEQVKERIEDPAQRARLDGIVTEIRTNRSVMSAAEAILAQTTDPAERNRLVQNVPLEYRSAVRKVVKEENEATREAENQSRELSFDRLQRVVLEGGNLMDPRYAADMTNIDVTQRQTLERYAQAPTNDDQAWLTFYFTPVEKLATMSESEFRSLWSKLSTSHRDDAERMRKAATTADAGPDGIRSYITPQEQISRAMRAVAGLSPFDQMSKASPEEQAAAVQFQNAADLALRQEETAKKRKLTPEEITTTIDRLRLDTYRVTEAARVPLTFGRGPMTTSAGRTREVVRPRFQIPDTAFARGVREGDIVLTLDRISPADSTRIVNVLTGNGIAATPQRIEGYYTAEMAGQQVEYIANLKRR